MENLLSEDNIAAKLVYDDMEKCYKNFQDTSYFVGYGELVCMWTVLVGHGKFEPASQVMHEPQGQTQPLFLL